MLQEVLEVKLSWVLWIVHFLQDLQLIFWNKAKTSQFLPKNFYPHLIWLCSFLFFKSRLKLSFLIASSNLYHDKVQLIKEWVLKLSHITLTITFLNAKIRVEFLDMIRIDAVLESNNLALYKHLTHCLIIFNVLRKCSLHYCSVLVKELRKI